MKKTNRILCALLAAMLIIPMALIGVSATDDTATPTPNTIYDWDDFLAAAADGLTVDKAWKEDEIKAEASLVGEAGAQKLYINAKLDPDNTTTWGRQYGLTLVPKSVFADLYQYTISFDIALEHKINVEVLLDFRDDDSYVTTTRAAAKLYWVGDGFYYGEYTDRENPYVQMPYTLGDTIHVEIAVVGNNATLIVNGEEYELSASGTAPVATEPDAIVSPNGGAFEVYVGLNQAVYIDNLLVTSLEHGNNHLPADSWVNTDPTHHWKECTGCADQQLEKAEHDYNNACDISCNTCGYIREVGEHQEGDWVVEIPAAVGVEGKENLHCSICNKVLSSRDIDALPAETTPVTDAPTTEAPATEEGCASVAENAWVLILMLLPLGIIISKKRQKI